MTSSEIRQSFLDFFKSKAHTIVPSSSLLPDSPNLLFTNAGMNQFVPIFLGQQKSPFNPPRAADTQKCIRAGGKHNDLEDVGLDTYHHTFFEMLGNWSFGDYFKKEAIEWAWELVTEVWKFPKNRLYATVYKPGPGDPSEFDQEAYDHWARLFTAAGLDPKVHIVYGNKKDNFWMMGETGPCGPCSEIHVDLTPEGDTKGSLVNKGDARCIEIWNLVFIQFNANQDGSFSPLPARHVDTGMGFERVTSIIQGTKGFSDFKNAKISNYETDVFRPIFDALERMSGKKYGSTLPTGLGSTGDSTVPLGDPPNGMETGPLSTTDKGTQKGASPPSAGPVAQRDRQVAYATREGVGGVTYSRRNLPHFEKPWAIYHVIIKTIPARKLSPGGRDIVLDCIVHWHDKRYRLVAACVMPDHAHFIIQPGVKEEDNEGKPLFWPLSEILHSIKSYSAKEINKLDHVTGTLWQAERYDRYMRGDTDLQEKFHYVCANPWVSGLVKESEAWPWLFPGSTGDSPVPLGDPPSGMETGPSSTTDGGPQKGASPRSAGSVTQRNRQVAGATQEAVDIAFRVIADHIRTLSFAIADGIRPGNTDRNYVLRRILRRAVRYGRTLGFHEPFFYKLVDVLAETMGNVFPEIVSRKESVQETIRAEEEAFNKTLDRGIELFNEEAKDKISAPFAFKLYDTYGFPLDLTELMARERGLSVDTAGFEKLMEEQRDRARKAQKRQVIEVSQLETTTPTKFVGYEQLSSEARVLDVVGIKDKTAVILDTSAAYAESGGQVGDTGELRMGGQLWRVVNTQKSGNTWLHFIADKDGPVSGSTVELTVDRPRREEIQRHHTVTHLFHWALHEVVSKEATQKGSYVGPEKLTFDFNSAALTAAQIRDVEKLVNERIVEGGAVSWSNVPYAEIKGRKDVMQFFGEKYGDVVRLVEIGDYSKELCGGTHTRNTGEIGLFRIVAESAIASGVRRIEAVAGLRAYEKMREEMELLNSLAGKVNSPVGELEKKVESLLAQQKDLEKQLKSLQQKQAAESARGLVAKAQAMGPVRAIVENLGTADGDYLQGVADALKGEFRGVIVLGGVAGGAVSLVAGVSPEFTAKIQAGKIIQAIAPIVGGKGGGRPDNARGGGRDASKLNEALTKASEILKTLN